LLPIALTTFILLFLFTGSVVLPIKALALNALSLTAVFGVDTVEAVATGLARTGRIVTTATALLAITFFAFGTAQVSFIQLFGIGTGIAIVLDASTGSGVAGQDGEALAAAEVTG
jgi:putative drug exporter of the RND superfamily